MLPYSFFKHNLEPQDSKLQNLRKKKIFYSNYADLIHPK
jgi:hypothetical protein